MTNTGQYKNRERNQRIIDRWEDGGREVGATELGEEMGLGKTVVEGVIRRYLAKQTEPWNESADPTARQVKIDQDGNTREISVRGTVIWTLEELLEATKTDLEKWMVTKHRINFWGNMDNPNTQVRAQLVPREPEQISPVVMPVQIRMGRLAKAQPRTGTWKRGVVLSDTQTGFRKSLRTGLLTPFHDRQAMDVALQIVQGSTPDFIAIIGDWLDLADWSDKFTRSPNFYWTTQPALLEVAWWLAQFRQASPGAEIVWIEGNHEARMPNAIIKNLQEGFGLRSVDAMNMPPIMSVPRLLALDDLGIEWVGDYPNGRREINPRLAVVHGDTAVAKSGGTVARVLTGDRQYSVMFGHTHRLELAYKALHGLSGSASVAAFSAGCLCRLDGQVPGFGDEENWTQGIGVFDYTLDGDHVILPVKIESGRAYFEGQMFEGRDRMDELIESTRAEDGQAWPF